MSEVPFSQGTSGLQTVSDAVAPSPEAAALAIAVLTGDPDLGASIGRVGDLFASYAGTDTVVCTLVSLRPADTSEWGSLGERAWLREWTTPTAQSSVAPQEESGPEEALSLPWISPRARQDVLAVVDSSELPEEAAQDRRELAATGVAAMVVRSLVRDGILYGSLSMTRGTPGPWPDHYIADVRLLSTALVARIAQEVARRSLIEAIERADAAHHSKEHFFAALGHELRTPITAIMGTAELLGEDARERAAADTFAASVAHDAEVVLRAAEQLHAIVEDLLGTGEELGGRAETQWVDVAEALADVEHWLGAQAHTAGITVEAVVAPGVLVRTTPSALRQILTNLVGNAIAYNTAGGTVQVSAAPAADEFGRARVRIVVRDDGPGLTPEQQEDVFKPFVRFAGQEVRGTGLGLSLSRSLAERDGGLMGVESTPGAGSVFWLDLASTGTS